jgi:hypothetical protein
MVGFIALGIFVAVPVLIYFACLVPALGSGSDIEHPAARSLIAL